MKNKQKKPFISLTSDFGVQTQGVGIMEAVALDICPDANVVHLMQMKDDYLRVEVAINMGSFISKYKVSVGEKIIIKKYQL